jgi:hypothetical protein
MSVCIGPGEGVEGEGCRPSKYISIDICTGTWVYFFLCIGCTYILTCLHGHIFHRRARRMCRRRRRMDGPRCILHLKRATTRSLNCWWYVQRGEEGENVRMCRTRGGFGRGKDIGYRYKSIFINICTYTYIYSFLYIGYICIYIYCHVYRINLSFCVDTYVFIYPYVSIRM